jgi:TIR domain-containing protein
MPNVFISHAAADRAFVTGELVPALTQRGINTWFSEEEIRTASRWEQAIRAGLESCDWFLVVLTPRSVASRWVQAEVHWALDERPDRFIPVLLETCDWRSLHLMLRTIQYVDFRSNREEAWRKLLAIWNAEAVGTLAPSPKHTGSRDERSATLRFVVSKMTGMLTPFHIYVDGEPAGKVERGKTLDVGVKPGRRRVIVTGVGTFKEASDEVSVEPGQICIWNISYTLLGGVKLSRT